MKLLAIDYGAKRLGLALCDEGQTLALAHGTHHRKSQRQSRRHRGVVGFDSRPRNWRSGDGRARVGFAKTARQTEDAAQRFGAKLREAAIEAGLELAWHRADERYSSALAARGLRASGVSARRAREDGLLDAGAACALLQTFLDARQTVASPEREQPECRT